MSGALFHLPESEIRRRADAIAPDRHAWVSANAGSGKTSILRDRVMRLLVEGVPPDRILCLTFTRAAAAEMQTRIFNELAKWVNLPDADLAAAIDRLAAGEKPSAERRQRQIERARCLFAEAVETPGGLKIQTIHAFAERILHLFPVEGGVPFDFTVMDDSDARKIRETVRRTMVDAALAFPDSELGRAFREITSVAGASGFSSGLDVAVSRLKAFRNHNPGISTAQAMHDPLYAQAFGGDVARTPADVDRAFLSALPDRGTLLDLLAAIESLPPEGARAGSTRIRRHLSRLRRHTADAARLDAVLDAVSTQGQFKPAANLLNAKQRKALPVAAALLDDLRDQAEGFIHERRAARAVARSRAMRVFADHVLDAVEREKARRSALDFDDLIARLATMLKSVRSAWVMLKLDAAIEHILVDEAQDTTPEMWQIIEALSEDFFSGEGQSRFRRSLFVVGDEKQSIFSFQGARPEIFDAVRRKLADRLDEKDPSGAFLREAVGLRYSFRSSGDILEAVDHAFAGDRAAGLTAAGEIIRHDAANEHFPGLVEVWPLVEPLPKPAAPDPDDPVDLPAPEHPAILSARQIASRIERMIAGETFLKDGKAIGAGDILILARERNTFFDAMLRELRRRNIPVAGADRLRLGDSIAIEDLLAIARASVQPEDDLSLAGALKSPFFGLGDPELEQVCRGRAGSLREAIAARASDDAVLGQVNDRLALLETRASALPPYEFFACLLAEPVPGHPGLSGRKAMSNRIGRDANDAIDAFLHAAMDFARLNPPTLAGFLTTGGAGEIEIKRDLDQGLGQVRVMTVHASKGLEARVVFIGDAALAADKGKSPAALLVPGQGSELLAWFGGPREDEPDAMRSVRDAERAARKAESRRLLYVAMTRAADRLYVTGFRHGRKPKDEVRKRGLDQNWHEFLHSAFEGAPDVTSISFDGAEQALLRWEPKRKARPFPASEESPAVSPVDHPGWLHAPLPAERMVESVLTPSAVGSRRDAPALDPAALGRGRLWHALLDAVPAVAGLRQRALADRMIADALPALGPEVRRGMVDHLEALLAHPGLARFIGCDSRSEVPVAGTVQLPGGRSRPVRGRIDRLVIADDRVEYLDFKLGHGRGAMPQAIIEQMALYRAVLRAAFPARNIVAHVLWINAARLETVPDAAMDAALEGIT
jgi:ATP-dependent helicase/nuclease subunit A